MSKKAMKQKTVEELLVEALVTEEEHSYEVPGNWIIANINSLFDIEYGKGLPISMLKEEGFPVYGANGKIGFYNEYTQEESKVLMTCRGATCGTINVTEPKSYVTSNSLILNPRWDASVKFVEFLFNYVDKRRLISGSAQPQVTIKAFSGYPIPLPPLSEQKRIAHKIQDLLNKIDEAKQLIDQAKETFELRKAAILDKAFRGYMTVKWREGYLNSQYCASSQNDSFGFFEVPPSWSWVKMEDLFDVFLRNGYSPKSTEIPTQTKTLKLGAITKGYFIEDFKYVEEDIDLNSYLWLKRGDFLIQRSNSIDYVGTSAIYTGEDNQSIYPDLIMKGKVNEDKIIPELLVLWVNSVYGKTYFRNNATGTAGNMPKINQKTVKNLPVPLPPFNEQQKLIEIIKKITYKEENIIKPILTSGNLDNMRQSILSKAFRGQLGTNDSTEESSIELLKEVLQEHQK